MPFIRIAGAAPKEANKPLINRLTDRAGRINFPFTASLKYATITPGIETGARLSFGCVSPNVAV